MSSSSAARISILPRRSGRRIGAVTSSSRPWRTRRDPTSKSGSSKPGAYRVGPKIHLRMDDSTRSFWDTWHDAYDDSESDLSHRLIAVRHRLSDAIDEAP